MQMTLKSTTSTVTEAFDEYAAHFTDSNSILTHKIDVDGRLLVSHYNKADNSKATESPLNYFSGNVSSMATWINGIFANSKYASFMAMLSRMMKDQYQLIVDEMDAENYIQSLKVNMYVYPFTAYTIPNFSSTNKEDQIDLDLSLKLQLTDTSGNFKYIVEAQLHNYPTTIRVREGKEYAEPTIQCTITSF